MKVQTSLQKKHAWTILLSSVAFALLPSMAFATNLTLPVSPSNPYDLTTLTENDAFTLFDATQNYSKAWCVLNPITAADEPMAKDGEGNVTGSTQHLLIQKDDQGRNYLSFGGTKLSPESYLALRIGSIDGTTYTPYALKPANESEIITTNLVITTRFEPSSDFPEMEDLQQLYFSYADREKLNETVTFGAAKMGICVDDDGLFYVARVFANPEVSSQLIFEWAETNVVYMAEPTQRTNATKVYVGNGRVDVKVEARAVRAEDDRGFVVAYRLWVKPGDADDTAYVCLSENLGYSWISKESEEVTIDGVQKKINYSIDYSSHGSDDWLFPIDMAATSLVDPSSLVQMDPDSLETLNMVGFSATSGGLYKVEMETLTAPDLTAVSTHNIGQFAQYGVLTASTFGLFSDWMTRYNVDLSNHLSSLTSNRSVTLLSMYETSQGCDTTEETFNAFLLDMDPSVGVVQKLHVKSVVPEGDVLTLTVAGPDGCSLKNATSRAGRLYVKRAATIAELATATSEPVDTIAGASIATMDANNLCVTLPREKGGIDMPFVQVTLEAIDLGE
ncbi:MAG: hypothetical protein Q4F99_02640 [bacterium]|nr:hypothetical protein [bacterium]